MLNREDGTDLSLESRKVSKIMNMESLQRNAIRDGYYNRYEGVEGVRRSYAMSGSDYATPGRHPIAYGDEIFVRVVRIQYGRKVLADFRITTVRDLCDIFGELRHYTRGERGLTRVYIRNRTRGWSIEQPFMLYGESRPANHYSPSVTKRIEQPERSGRTIPESVMMLCNH